MTLIGLVYFCAKNLQNVFTVANVGQQTRLFYLDTTYSDEYDYVPSSSVRLRCRAAEIRQL